MILCLWAVMESNHRLNLVRVTFLTTKLTAQYFVDTEKIEFPQSDFQSDAYTTSATCPYISFNNSLRSQTLVVKYRTFLHLVSVSACTVRITKRTTYSLRCLYSRISLQGSPRVSTLGGIATTFLLIFFRIFLSTFAFELIFIIKRVSPLREQI